MNTNWNDFIRRRNVNVARFLEVNGIKDRSELVNHLLQIGVDPPDDSVLLTIFPHVTSNEASAETVKPVVMSQPVEQASVREKSKNK